MYPRKKQIENDPRGTLGRHIRELRTTNKIDIANAAESVGYSVQMWRNIEAGKSFPKSSILPRMANVLGCDELLLFKLWAVSKLEGDECHRLRRRILWSNSTAGDPDRRSTPRASRELFEALSAIPLDPMTSKLMVDLSELVVQYRRGLTAANATKKQTLRTVDCSRHDDSAWSNLRGKAHIWEQPIARDWTGIGYYASLVKIDAHIGAFHQHIENRYLDAGREFVCVIKGKAVGVFQHPKKPKWENRELLPGTCLVYRGDYGHCFLNTDSEPLIMFVVCIPIPPALTTEYGRSDGDDENQGAAEGIEFRLKDYRKARLPTALKDEIRLHRKRISQQQLPQPKSD